MSRHPFRNIDSEHNEVFKELRKLLTSRGIKKQQKALVFGLKQVHETIASFPENCIAWLSGHEDSPPPTDAPHSMAWYKLSPPLLETLDLFGTHSPLLLIKTPAIPQWVPESGLPEGCSVVLPFQDPENVGAAIRSAVAFGVSHIILLKDSAHPYHPKAMRASGGAVLRARCFQGPALKDLPDGLAYVPLSSEGKALSSFSFPSSFAFLPGIEGAGIPDRFRGDALSIPVRPEVESLNASVALAIALYVWSQQLK
jgi:tRNA G18 (ribose-2'-O)-methylase SpoU